MIFRNMNTQGDINLDSWLKHLGLTLEDINNKKVNIYSKQFRKAIDFIKAYSHFGVILVVDSDADGYTSSAIMYRLMKMLNVDVEYIIHEKRQHGLSKDIMAKLSQHDGEYFGDKLIIIPDAGSSENDKQEIEFLLKLGHRVLCVDHHTLCYELENEMFCMVNNSVDDINRNYTGASLCLALYACFISEGLIDAKANHRPALQLGMIGSLADMADTHDKEIRGIINSGLDSDNFNFLTHFEMKNNIEKRTCNTLTFSGIIPMINSIIRSEDMEVQDQLMKCLVDDFLPSDFYYDVIKKGQSIKRKLDNIVKKRFEEIEVDDNSIIIAVKGVEGQSSIGGVLANKLQSTYNKLAFVYTELDNGTFAGSCRGNTKVLSNFKEEALKCPVTIDAIGHSGAFGLTVSDINKFVDYFNNLEDTSEAIFEVFGVYDTKEDIISRSEISELMKQPLIYENSIKKPRFALLNCKIDDLSRNRAMTSFYVNKLKIARDFTNKLYYEQLENAVNTGKRLHLLVEVDNVVYQNQVYPRLQLVEYTVAQSEVQDDFGFTLYRTEE